MLTGTEQLVLRILKESITENSIELPKELLSNESEIVKTIINNGILLTVYPAIKKEQSLRQLQSVLKMHYLAGVSQLVQQEYEGKKILSALNDQGIDCIPLKGWVLKDLYILGADTLY